MSKKEKEPKLNKKIFNLIRNKSIEEINAKEAKVVSDEEIKRIIDKNFNDMYKKDYEEYFEVKEKYNKSKKYVIDNLVFGMFPLFIAACITVGTGTCYAIANRDNLDVAFNKYHGTCYTEECRFIDNKDKEWSESITFDEMLGYDSYVKTVVPRNDDTNIVDVNYFDVNDNEASLIGDLLINDENTVKEKYINNSTYTNNFIQHSYIEYNSEIDDVLIEVYSKTKKEKDILVESDEKKDEYSNNNYDVKEPRWKTIKRVGTISGIAGLILSGIVILGLWNDDNKLSEHKNIKNSYKLAKKKRKDLGKK